MVNRTVHGILTRVTDGGGVEDEGETLTFGLQPVGEFEFAVTRIVRGVNRAIKITVPKDSEIFNVRGDAYIQAPEGKVWMTPEGRKINRITLAAAVNMGMASIEDSDFPHVIEDLSGPDPDESDGEASEWDASDDANDDG